MLPRILIVEDETVLRSAMARALAKLPALVDDAATVAEAVAHLDRAIPDVIISDLDLPDGTGIELIGELGRRKARVPVVFVSAYLRAYRAQIPPHADVEVREKPIELDELRALVRDRLRPRDDDSAPFGVTDYIQLACLGKHSVVIEVTHHGQARGRLEVVDGEIWHAEDTHGGGGLDAFRRLAFATEVEAHCHTLAGPRGPRTIDGRWEALLMDSARVWDERGPGDDLSAAALDLAFDTAASSDEVAWPPDTTSGFAEGTAGGARPAPPAPDRFGALYDRAIEALLIRDYATAVQAFAEAHALRPDDRQVAANLERLAALGYPAAAHTLEDHDA